MMKNTKIARAWRLHKIRTLRRIQSKMFQTSNDGRVKRLLDDLLDTYSPGWSRKEYERFGGNWYGTVNMSDGYSINVYSQHREIDMYRKLARKVIWYKIFGEQD